MKALIKPFAKLLTTLLLTCIYTLALSQTIDSLKFGPQNEKDGAAVDEIIAVVGDDIITRSEIGAYANANLSTDEVLNTLIMRKILLQEANRYNIKVNDTTINLAMEDYLKDNKRSLNSLSADEVAALRSQISEDLTIQRLKQNILRRNIKISEKEIDSLVEREYKTLADSVQLIDVLVPIDSNSEGIAGISSQQQIEVRAIYDLLVKSGISAVQSQYTKVKVNDLGWVELNKIPPRFAKGLVDVKKGEFAAAPITDSDGIHILKVVDRKNSDDSSKLDVVETKAQHILIRNNDSEGGDAEQQIQNVYQQIQNGVSFADAAITYSQDYGTAAKGGDLGWVLPGQMVNDFEDAMNQLAIGQISEPVKTTYGWHLIKVNDRRQVSTSNEETIRQQAYQKLFSQRSEETWNLWMREVRDQTHVEIR